MFAWCELYAAIRGTQFTVSGTWCIEISFATSPVWFDAAIDFVWFADDEDTTVRVLVVLVPNTNEQNSNQNNTSNFVRYGR